MTDNSIQDKLTIDSEFQSLIPPLSGDEYDRLEKSILIEGVRDPIITWNDTIIDGHNRYHICQEHGIGFKTAHREFESRDAAKIWIIENQFARRNLTKYDRGVLTLQLKPLYAAEAKRRQSEAGGDHGNQHTGGKTALSQKSDEPPLRTDEQLAKLAGVSRDTIRKIEVIETEAAKGNEVAMGARNAVKDGKKSIHAAYGEIRKSNTKEDRRICSICGKPINEGEAYDYEPTTHKKCRTNQHVIAQRKYRNPSIGNTNEVLTHNKDELREALLLIVQDMGETIESTIRRYETMGVKLKQSEANHVVSVLGALAKSIESIKG